MEMEKGDMCQSLIEWFKTLNLTAPHSNLEELSDGVALAQALNQFAPEVFTNLWLSKINSGINWRLKMSNLKKVIEGVYDYYSDVLSYSLADFPRPDAQRIAEKCDAGELERLLQLVLGCAVNCVAKQDYIRQIMSLEESLQANIMRALQDLESTWQGGKGSLLCPSSSLSIANFDYKILQEERDALAQKCFEAENKMLLLVEEKSGMQQELAKLQVEVERLTSNIAAIGDDGVSLGPVQAGSARYSELRRQLDRMKEELIQSDATREDLKLKVQQQEKEIQSMQQRIDELTKNTSELIQLKDEVDVLRESNDKLKEYEIQLETYKKRLEEYNDLKKHSKILEERNADYVQQIMQFEEDAKKSATLKGQVELFKNKIQDLHTQLDGEMSKNVKLEFDNKNLESNISALQRAKESLLKERDNLREALDELKCGQLSTSSGSLNGNTMSKELQPTALAEKVHRLELENKALREGQGGQTALTQLLDDANKRNENLREQLKSANERILSLSHASQSGDPNLKEFEFGKQIKQLMELNEQKTIQLEESVSQNVSLQSKITQLENTLTTREQDLLAYDAKYRKCVEKAKEVIKNLDPRFANVIEANLLERPQDSEEEPKARMSTVEERLMTTAFYRLGVNAQRDAIDAKLALLMGQGQTFLARQRQSAPRKSLTTFKNK
ncbi:protein hook [Anastrepha ludens]|uniref:protein hook n=1 Tax=Anastrepha ludens TaxID=28586 RepID=UPI0023B1F346|nr:protein hook [Anastrepha ludens]